MAARARVAGRRTTYVGVYSLDFRLLTLSYHHHRFTLTHVSPLRRRYLFLTRYPRSRTVVSVLHGLVMQRTVARSSSSYLTRKFLRSIFGMHPACAASSRTTYMDFPIIERDNSLFD